MKHCKKILSVFAIALAFGACLTTGKVKEEPFTVDPRSPRILLGTIDAQFERFLSIGGLQKSTVTVQYVPKEDAVCLQYRMDFMTYNQFWSRDGRETFLRAVEQYKEDYEQRNLNRRDRNSSRKYGVVQGYLIWRMSAITTQAYGVSKIEIGYRFRDTASSSGGRQLLPYFTTHQLDTFYEDTMSRDNSRTSPKILMYFTRTQADALAAFFDQQFLLEFAANNAASSILDDEDFYDDTQEPAGAAPDFDY